MQKLILECIDGRCPTGVDKVKKVILTPKEKKAIFLRLEEEISKDKTKRGESS